MFIRAMTTTRHTLILTALGLITPAAFSGSPTPAFPDIIQHKNVSQPVQILNVFPEHGLTDPHVMQVNGRLYMGMGHDKTWDTETDWTMDRWEIWSTNDLTTWRKETTMYPADTYIGQQPNAWAGDFAQKDGKYYWYFSNRNIDTGVMVATHPGGPYKDALGKPLLPEGIAPTHPYDPEVFEENGVYTIIFGAGAYYAATLAEDMISLASEPVPIIIKTKDGKVKPTDDKPTVFKREDIYYLVWGADYAMSDKLLGPYQYAGDFMGGGHGSIFNWQKQWYVVHEHHDISMYYRGIMIKPLIFNDDGTVNLVNDTSYPEGGGRVWEFEKSVMGWRAVANTSVNWNSTGTISGDHKGSAIIESANWASASLEGTDLSITLKNQSDAKSLRIYLAEFATNRPEFWKYSDINWSNSAQAELAIKPNDQSFSTYTLDLSTVDKLPNKLKRLRLEFPKNVNSGKWEIESIYIQ
ncbi:family 43 glycosylhydrolase [Gilvimarinus polysaccharolyticus]|uniref:family 43 glycosylhydrolase n=1 Tax=Gilvimarinus polysaccharolyticus TaxID=863921 RepID=UPI000673A59B|nr:family 43 glycosylhydrolase [Gilvimarinus polysaccharolyticus]